MKTKDSQSNTPFAPIPSKPSFPAIEESILQNWQDENIFERSVENRGIDRSFVFYDGPPFATGLPHFGHLLQGTVKDLIPRYKTMRGYRVERRFGWDCHGLPIELEIEKNLDLNGRPDIISYGVDKYNEECRSTVLRYTQEWRAITERMGRWIDFDNDYKTMDRSFMESVWYVFKRLWDEELVYEGRKVLPYSWRLATPVSNSEASLNYMDVQDPSVTIRFRVKGKEKTSLLVWTTTPWTLVSNLAVCAHPEFQYVEIQSHEDQENYILCESLLDSYFKESQFTLIRKLKGRELKGIEYEPLFEYASQRHDTSKCFQVVLDTYVTDESGTGLVHQAPAFGEDDLRICQSLGIPVFDPIDESGAFETWIEKFSGMNFKEADKHICRDLKERGLMFLHQTMVHNYPFCWRTDTPLMYKAMPAWFVNIEKIKDRLLKNAEEIHWIPGHIKDGRFGKWLENAKDWAISRNRFWGCPLPVWVSDEGDMICFGSVEELEKISSREIQDIHKHFVDEISFEKDGKTYRRVPEVLDCWFESGSMPYGQQHYPFENQEIFEENFPADFICEAIDQTRCWFYYLHVIGTALFDRPAFRNVICTGLILAADGKKLSKRHKNYTPPMEVFHTYGADALRYFLVTSPVVKGQEVRFSDEEVKEVVKSTLLPLWNVFSFLVNYANIDGYKPVGRTDSTNTLDRYILSEFHLMLDTVTRSLDVYELNDACRSIENFLETLTNWYVRRSRRRFWKSETDADKVQAYETLYSVLRGLCKVLAPIMPYLPEFIFQHLSGEESVHLSDWEEANLELIDRELCAEMDAIRTVVSLGHSLRARNRIKVRKPLLKMEVAGALSAGVLKKYEGVILDELNVKEVAFVEDASRLGEVHLKLNAKILGPKLGKDFKKVLNASRERNFELKGDQVLIEERILEEGEFDLTYRAQEGHDCASEKEILVSLDLNVTEELVLEGHAREIIRHLQTLRKEAQLELSERIHSFILTDNSAVRDAVEKHRDLISQETLSLEIHSKGIESALERREVQSDDIQFEVGVRKL